MLKRRSPAPDAADAVLDVERKRRMIERSTDDADRLTVGASKPKCFRISGIPPDWSDARLLGALQAIDPSLEHQEAQNHQLSLFPACYGPLKPQYLPWRLVRNIFRI
jgi:hypothetical protein